MTRIASLLGFAAMSLGASSSGGAQALPRAPVQSDTSYGCTVCHAAQREALVVGVHAARGIRCTECHGGNAEALEVGAAHRGNFASLRDKAATAQRCGSCHSDPNRMRQFGLQTGQLAEFRTSRHGQLLFSRHDTNAPTCTNCHGTHVIYRPDDGRSSVYPTKLPGTCSGCHSDRALMARYGLPTNQFEQFRKGAHGMALFEQQNFAAPTCVGCHGAHSALPPGVVEIANVCSRCHELVGEAAASGPHGAAARSGKLPGCLGCHSNHGTERVPPEQLAGVCEKCHAGDGRIRETGLAIQKLVVRATEDLGSAAKALEQLRQTGRRSGDHLFRYQSAVSYYLQIAQVQHSLDLDRLDDLERRVRSISVQLGEAAEAATERRWEHKLILVPVWFLGLSALALAGLVLRRLREEKGNASPR